MLRWYFDFQIRGARYREAIPEARTKFQAEQAETKARDQVFQGTYGTSQFGNQELRPVCERNVFAVGQSEQTHLAQ